jgi:Leucine-rich repeat (LRR) protein
MTKYLERSADYDVAEDSCGYGNALILRRSWAPKFYKVVEKYRIKIIRLNDRVGWGGSDVSFVVDIPGIRGVDIISDKVTDVSPIFQLKELKTLSLFCRAKRAGDFTNLGDLENLGLAWRNVYESAFELNSLSRVNILGFPNRELSGWKPSKKLKQLRLESNRLETLGGIERFPRLGTVDLCRCRKLTSLAAIKHAPSLRKMSLASCPAIQDLSPLSRLAELRELSIEDCGDIQTLSPIAKCRKLETLQIAGNTNVIDGNFNSLTKLPKLKRVLLKKQKHYSHTDRELEKR